MERTQISLEPEQADLLRRLASERGVSMAHLIRDAVDQAYGTALVKPSRAELWQRAMRAAGSGASGRDDIALNHDQYLDEIYGT